MPRIVHYLALAYQCCFGKFNESVHLSEPVQRTSLENLFTDSHY